VLIITHIHPNSFAEELGLKPGDGILSINNHPIQDALDFQFWSAEDELEIEFQQGEQRLVLEVEDGLDDLGCDFEELTCKSCGNNCVFCFVDQNPAGVRKSLLFKDEDYRYSFMYGNYVTLTNVSQKDLRRIAEQRLSPLYISVHAIDTAVRKKMLGIRGNDKLLAKLNFLAEHHIEMHAQVVLCPGWNDGTVLEETVDTLAGFFPHVQTLAVVPVGLTKHRTGLVPLRPVSPQQSAEIIAYADIKAAHFQKKFGSHFLYIADEFYMLADYPVPAAERYEGFAQIENGVGMVRQFLDDVDEEKKNFPAKIKNTILNVVTGTSAHPILQHQIKPELEKIDGLTIRVHPIDNHFFGGHVSVAGLLVGQDIAAQLAHAELGDAVVLPPDCLNFDGVFLDDWTVADLQKVIDKPVYQYQTGFLDILKELEK